MADERTERAIDIIVDGFMDNPVLGWVFQDEATRADGIRGYVEVFLAAYGERGVLDIDEGGRARPYGPSRGRPSSRESTRRRWSSCSESSTASARTSSSPHSG